MKKFLDFIAGFISGTFTFGALGLLVAAIGVPAIIMFMVFPVLFWSLYRVVDYFLRH